MFKNISLAFFTRSLGAASGFLMSIMIAQSLSTEQAGYFFLAFALLNVFVPISLFGTDSASLRFIGSAHSEGKWNEIQGYVVITTKIVITASLVISLLLWLSAFDLAQKIWKKPEMVYLIKKTAFALFLFSLSTLFSFHLQAISKVVKSVLLLSIILPIGISVCIFFLDIQTADKAIDLVIILSFLNLFIGIIFWIKSSTINFKKIELPEFHSLIAVCFPLWIITIFSTISTWGSSLIAASWISPEEIAYLSTAQRTAGLISFILIAVNLVMAPKFAALYNKNNMKDLEKLATKATKIMAYAAIPSIIFILIFSKRIMGIFGESFIEASHLLIVLSIGQLVNVLTGSVGYLLMMSGHEKDMRNIVLFASSITILLTFYMTAKFGVTGAAIATAIGLSVQNLVAAWFVEKRLGFSTLTFWKKTFR